MTTWSTTKASALDTTIVRNPSVAPSATLAGMDSTPSHNDVSILYMLHRRRAIASDTSATSLERPSFISLIENVDMGKFIEDLMKTKFLPLAYYRIHWFLTKICVPIFVFSHFVGSIFFFFICFSLEFCCVGWSRPYSTQRQTKGSHIHWHAYSRCVRGLVGAEDLDLLLGCFAR